MNRIVSTRTLAEGVKDFTVEAPIIARKRQAGQFVLVRVSDSGERIPLTIVDSDPEAGTIRLIFQEVGRTTMMMGDLNPGEHILDVVGPLGRPTHIERLGLTVCIGGGIGVAPIYPIAKALKNAGNRLVSVIGARSKDLLILEAEMTAVSDRLMVTTDDGSYGRKGFVTDALRDIISGGEVPDLVVAIGPVVMMKAVARVTGEFSIPTVVSLNSTMVDGTGMCGGCRVTVGGKTKFVCVDGPEFDGLAVDYDELMLRQRAYIPQEKLSRESYEEIRRHQCRLEEAS